MNISGLKRNPDLINRIWVEKDGKVITKSKCSIMVPYSYFERRMLRVGQKITTLAVCMVVCGDEYFVLNGGVWIWISPDASGQVQTDDGEYMKFDFLAGSVVIPDTLTVKDSDLTYAMDKYFIGGRIPAFLSYDDVGNLFMYHKEFGGLNISATNIPFELIVSIMSHDPVKKFDFYREGPMTKTPLYVPFRSVIFNTTNTTSKILGNYLEDGFTSALLSPTVQAEPIENLLRA